MTNYTVMLIDDEQDLLDVLTNMLRHLPVAVTKVNDAQTALEMMYEEPPDLIVLDVAMPGMNGLELLRQVRAEHRFATVKIMLLTAVPVMVDNVSASKVDKFCTKPINMREFLANVKHLLGM